MWFYLVLLVNKLDISIGGKKHLRTAHQWRSSHGNPVKFNGNPVFGDGLVACSSRSTSAGENIPLIRLFVAIKIYHSPTFPKEKDPDFFPHKDDKIKSCCSVNQPMHGKGLWSVIVLHCWESVSFPNHLAIHISVWSIQWNTCRGQGPMQQQHTIVVLLWTPNNLTKWCPHKWQGSCTTN